MPLQASIFIYVIISFPESGANKGELLNADSKLVLDEQALVENYFKLLSIADGKVICVVKANAYGHGAVAVTKALYSVGARLFAVANVDEGATLRKRLGGLIGARIISLGVTAAENIKRANKYAITLPIGSLNDFFALEKSKLDFDIYFQVDTGMRRLGFDHAKPEEFFGVASLVGCCPRLTPVGIGTHLSCGEDENSSRVQTARFCPYSAMGKISVSASSAFLREECVGEYKRAGLCLYGYGEAARLLGLKKPLSLYTRIVRTITLDKGEKLGYNAVFEAKRKMLVGTLPIGYADGIMRAYRGASVFVRGKDCPILAVCMDMTMIGLPPQARVGDEVTVFSSEGNLERLTDNAGTIVYEGLTALGNRLRRLTVKS